MKYTVRDSEAGNVIETGLTLEKAEAMIASFEAADKADGIYEENFYEVVGEGD